MKIINAGVTAPKGFKCAGLRAGVKPGKTNKDMAMIVSEVPAKIAGTFTKNIVKAAPVLWGKKIVEEQEAVRAVVINTGIANACTGAQGYENVVTEAKEVAKLLDIKPEEVVVGSTGVIGQQLPMDVIKEGIKKLVPELKADRQSEEDASWAILTTDTKPKEAAVEVEIDGKTVTIAGMCKGSGMIHPNMGTMLGFITTDAAIDKALLLELQRELIEDTFNMVSVDGDTSTNDTVFVFANGMAENKEITEKDADYEAFREGLLYAKSHEWVKEEGDVVTIGLTDYAQSELGDLVFVNLPEEGDSVSVGEAFGDVESVKAVSDVYSPISGVVCEINEELLDAPESINGAPYDAWFIKVKEVSEKEELLSPSEYEAFVASEQ